MKSQYALIERKPSAADLDARFSSTQWIFNFCMIVIGMAFALGTHAALVGANRHLAFASGQTLFAILPQSAIWWFFPGLGAVTLGFEITLQLWSLFDRYEADLYAYWSGLNVTISPYVRPANIDSRSILRRTALFFALPVGLLTLLALPMHSTLTKEEIRSCGYAFTPCKVYRYADARRMTIVDGFRTRDGRLTRRAGIVIDFKDGRRWSSADEGDFNPQVDSALQELLADRTHIPYNYAQTPADTPPLESVQ